MKVTEADIATVAVASLQRDGWDCYPEVRLGELTGHRQWGGGVADVVAVRGPLVMIVECKVSYSLQLIEQALEWVRVAPLVAVAARTVETNRKELRRHMADYHGVGSAVAAVGGKDIDGGVLGDLRWLAHPRLLRANLRHVPDIQGVLTPAMRAATAGARTTYRHSQFQQTLTEVRILVLAYGPMPLVELVELLAEQGHHYASDAGARQGIGAAIRNGWVEDLYWLDGKVAFNPVAWSAPSELSWLYWRAATVRLGRFPGWEWRKTAADEAAARLAATPLPQDRHQPAKGQMKLLGASWTLSVGPPSRHGRTRS